MSSHERYWVSKGVVISTASPYPKEKGGLETTKHDKRVNEE